MTFETTQTPRLLTFVYWRVGWKNNFFKEKNVFNYFVEFFVRRVGPGGRGAMAYNEKKFTRTEVRFETN